MSIQDKVNNYLKSLSEVGIGYAYEGQVEEVEKKFLTELLSTLSAPVVFDVGCNVGHYTRSIKTISPAASVYCFEPHPTAFEAASIMNGKDRIQVFNLAVGDVEGEFDFFDAGQGSNTTLSTLHKGVIEDLHGLVPRSFKVNVKSIDSIVKMVGVSRINLLKVDTEGHELAVFRSAKETFAANMIDVVQFEFNDMNIVSRTFFKDFFEFFHNYTLIRLTPSGGMFIDKYIPILHEIFALQTIVGFRKDIMPGYKNGS